MNPGQADPRDRTTNRPTGTVVRPMPASAIYPVLFSAYLNAARSHAYSSCVAQSFGDCTVFPNWFNALLALDHHGFDEPMRQEVHTTRAAGTTSVSRGRKPAVGKRAVGKRIRGCTLFLPPPPAYAGGSLRGATLKPPKTRKLPTIYHRPYFSAICSRKRRSACVEM